MGPWFDKVMPSALAKGHGVANMLKPSSGLWADVWARKGIGRGAEEGESSEAQGQGIHCAVLNQEKPLMML